MKKMDKQILRKNFRNAIAYLKESKNYIWAIALIFAVGIIVGFIFSGELSFLEKFIEEILKKTEGLNTGELILFIFQNNLISSLYGMVFGIVLGVLPVFTSLFNGLVLGYVFRRVWDSSGIREFWRILPHGIFELPAVFISLALGLKLGMFIFAKNKKEEFRQRLLKSLIIFIAIVIPLLAIAAVIESILISFYK